MSIKCISIQAASAGMVLAKPVVDENGRTLCGENTVLSEKIIAQFARNNISGIYILSDEKISEEEYQRMRHEIDIRFAHLPAKSLHMDLKEIMLEILETRK